MTGDRSQSPPTEEDTGKPVVTPDDTQIGIISAVDGGRVRVDPDPSLAEAVRAVLGWGDDDETYSLDASALERDPSADVAVFRVDPDELDRE